MTKKQPFFNGLYDFVALKLSKSRADKIDGELEILLQEMIDEYLGTVILASEDIIGDKRLNASDGLFSYQKGQKRLTK